MTAADFTARAEHISAELAALRRSIHSNPELGRREFNTARLVETYLNGCGIETHRAAETGVVGILRGAKPGKTAALRADMDALHVTECSGAEFSSKNAGVMHACGHDVHTAALLGAAKLLSDARDDICGCVKFFFQPDEEGDGGAARMINGGCMDDVDAVFGAHVVPELPLGTVGVKYGKFYAASNPFKVSVTGKSAHAAMPENGIDALYAAALLSCRLKELSAALSSDNGRTIITVGSLHSGSACNILSGSAEMAGIIRTLGPEARQTAIRSVFDAVHDVSAKTSAVINVDMTDGYPGIVNDDGACAHVFAAAGRLFGEGGVIRLDAPVMTTEDFGYFLQRAPGCFFHIGAGTPVPLHNPDYLPDERVISPLCALEAYTVWSFLQGAGFAPFSEV